MDIAAVNLHTQTKKISIFYLGALAAVVHDAINKYFRFNIPIVYLEDIVLQRKTCMNSSEGDVAYRLHKKCW